MSSIASRIAKRSSNPFDDQFVALVHRPIFLSFVFLGLGLASKRMQLPLVPTFITISLLKTFAIFVWYNTLRQLMGLIEIPYPQRDLHVRTMPATTD